MLVFTLLTHLNLTLSLSKLFHLQTIEKIDAEYGGKAFHPAVRKVIDEAVANTSTSKAPPKRAEQIKASVEDNDLNAS